MNDYTTISADHSAVTNTLEIDPGLRLREAFRVFNVLLFNDELPYHVMVPRPTRGYIYDGTTHELAVHPDYFGYPELTGAELIHLMWHVRWALDDQRTNTKRTKHKGHYHPVKREAELRRCGLQPITDPLLREFLGEKSYEAVVGTEAHAAIQYVIESGILVPEMDARPINDRHRSKCFKYKCPKCPYEHKSQSADEYNDLLMGRLKPLGCGKCDVLLLMPVKHPEKKVVLQ